MKQKLSIAFLFLDEIHHINHFISVAVALSKNHQVSIVTYPSDHKYLFNALERLEGSKVKVEMLKTHWFRSFTDKIKNRTLPRKGFWMKNNKNYLLSNFDALVFTDYIHKPLLKYRGNASWPKFILFPHGVAGRAFSYKIDIIDFDLHLIFGDFHFQQLKLKNLLGNKTVVLGYPKMEALESLPSPILFNNKRPIVLYNPHFTPELSSWFKDGEAVLNYFKSQDKYNLIFAPHINLFNKVGGDTLSSFIKSLEDVAHIHIDLGSQAAVDMVYTKMADIYIGDVSSQTYEFMINPRPCIYINSHQVDYKNDANYRFWECGDVISSTDELNHALTTAPKRHYKIYKSIQNKITQGNFYTEKGSTISERFAVTIENFIYEEQKIN